jgi:tetratricopeptide (TPR) repeat protein
MSRMRNQRRAAALIIVIGCMTMSAASQSRPAEPTSTPPERSHVERFSPPQQLLADRERSLTQQIEAHPDNAQSFRDRAEVRMQLGMGDAAIADLRRATQLEPASADLHSALGAALWRTGHADEATAEFQSALDRDKGNATSHFYIGRAQLMAGHVDDAIEHLQASIERSPEDIEVNFELFAAYRAKHDWEQAAMQLRLLRAVLPPDHPGGMYAEGLLQEDLGNLVSAVERFQQALTKNPSLDRVRQELGITQCKLERWRDAAETLAPLVSPQSKSFPAAYFYALALNNLGKIQEAERAVSHALVLDSGSADAQTLYATILSRRGANADAAQVLSRVTSADPGNFDAQFALGRVLYAMRDLPGAVSAFQAAVGLRPQDAEARFFLATVLEVNGEKGPAIAAYRDLVRVAPNDVRGYVGLGAVLAKYGEEEDARQQLRHALELDAKSFEATLNLGRLLLKNSQTAEALPLLDRAVQQMPNSPEAHYQLGLALRRAGKTEASAHEFAVVDKLNRERRSASGMSDTRSPQP